MQAELLVAGNKGQLDISYDGQEAGTMRLGWAPVDYSEHASEQQLKNTMDNIEIK